MTVADASNTRFWVLRTREHWLRCDHLDTALDAEREVVTLARNLSQRAANPIDPGDPAQLRYGVAIDCGGRIWRSVPLENRVERLDENGVRSLGGPGQVPGSCPQWMLELVEPRGLAIDLRQRLYIAEAGARRVTIVDLSTGRLVARLRPPGVAGRTPRPWDLAADPSGRGAFLLDRGTRAVWRIRPDRGPVQLLGPRGEWEHAGRESLHDPVAILAAPDGAVVVLDRAAAAGKSQVQVVWARRHDIRTAALPEGADDPLLGDATTFALDGDGHLLVGGDPAKIPRADGTLPRGADAEVSLVRYLVDGVGPDELAAAVSPTSAVPGGGRATSFELHTAGDVRPWSFDGGALLTDVDGDVLYTTRGGLSSPAAGTPNYVRTASVVTFALDSGDPGTVWHRAFFEACLPEHTGLRVSTRTSDELGDPVPLHPPQGFAQGDTRPETTAGGYVPPRDAPDWMPMPRLLRRPAGADRPFYQPQYVNDEVFDLYEGLVFSPPGRYLWLQITLDGTDRVTPVVAGLRVYYPRPSYLRYLPEIYREEPRAAEFLDRLLSLFEVFHSELDNVRDHLAVLFEPQAVPGEALDWLSGWLGLVLDPRWDEGRRRNLVAAAARLYRDRGTLQGMTDFLRIYTDHPFQLIEAFRTRQAGGIVVREAASPGENVVGASMVIHEPTSILADTRGWAHRFTLFVAAELTDVERAVIGDIIETEKPAHTLGDLCDVTETFTVGQRALVGISTLVGKARCLRPAVLGDEGWPVGREVVLGGQRHDEQGVAVGTINLGRNTTIR